MSLGMGWKTLRSWDEYQRRKRTALLEQAKSRGWVPKNETSFSKYLCKGCEKYFEGHPAWIWESDSMYSEAKVCW
jgi:hypothetical protein